MRSLYFVLAITIFPLALLANIGVPDGDPLQTLLQLIANWKASSPIAIGMGIIVFVVQAMKKFLGDFKFKRAIVTVLGVAYSVLVAIVNGLSPAEAAVMVLFVSGGAVALYEAIKPLLSSGQPA
jgi:type IV secretory pathway VirB2 component (pilin)